MHAGDEGSAERSAGVPAGVLTVWRPRKLRFVGHGLAMLIVATTVVLAVVLPPEWRIADRIAMLVFGQVCMAGLLLLARPRVVATESGVTVVNCIRTHVLVWPEILDVRMPEGEPWPTIDLANGSTLGAMGIQSNDGALARAQVTEFLGLVRERGEAQEPGRG